MARNRAGVMAILVLGFATAIVISCARRTTKATLPLTAPEAFSDTGAQEVPGQWWTTFGDTGLNRLVNRALQSNFNLETAWQRLREARAVVDRESSSLFPDLEALFQGEVRSAEVEDNEQLRLGLTSAYEVDLWGRIGYGIEAERYRARATFADYRTAVISLSAEVARSWYQLMEARHQLDLVEQQIQTNEEVLSLIETRFGSGQIRSVDILRQRQLLESTREQKISTESRIQVLEHQLAVLLGRSPQERIDYTQTQLPELPPLPDTGLPIELIRRRPDVQRTYRELQAADRDLAAAISNQYPRLTLTASVSTAGNNTGNLFQDWVSSFAANLLAPIFFGGELSAEADRTEAITKQRLNEYGQTILTAFQEVEDALIQEKKQIERIQSIEAQISFARQTLEQLRIEFFNGISNYLDVLTALISEQQLRRDLLSAKLALLDFRIALYRALAGGFETEREVQNDRMVE